MGTSSSLLSGYFIQPTRRSYSKSFKAQVIQECAQPGTSVDGFGVRLAARRLNQGKFYWPGVCHGSETELDAAVPSALRYIQLLFEIESEVRDLEPDLRRRIRQEKAVPIMNTLHAWMIAQRDLVPEGSAISKALDYSLKRWAALSRYLDDGAVTIDNNWAENQIRPWLLDARTGYFPGRYAVENGLRRS